MSGKKERFINTHHNEVRDLTANLLSNVCHNMQIEPTLQPLNGADRTAQRQLHQRSKVRYLSKWILDAGTASIFRF